MYKINILGQKCIPAKSDSLKSIKRKKGFMHKNDQRVSVKTVTPITFC